VGLRRQYVSSTLSSARAQLRRAVPLIALLALPMAALDTAAAHDKAYWQALRADHFNLPPDEAVAPLVLEAATLLGSTDPELRDGIAYEAMIAWVYKEPGLSATELEQLRATLVANARRGLGEPESDALFLRSFSTLALSVLAATDLKRPFLGQPQFDELLELALAELGGERDLRGYIPGKGWGHATAHTADLLKFLARSHWLRAQQQTRIVDAVAARLRTAGIVFVWGEDARLAAALTSLARREDADPAPFNAWFKRLAAEQEAAWAEPFDPSRYVAVRAQLNALSALGADLTADSGAEAAVRSGLRTLRDHAQ
jgi:Protein of unknown function (DUF2785)